jgi:hypothetical protein
VIGPIPPILQVASPDVSTDSDEPVDDELLPQPTNKDAVIAAQSAKLKAFFFISNTSCFVFYALAL